MNPQIASGVYTPRAVTEASKPHMLPAIVRTSRNVASARSRIDAMKWGNCKSHRNR